MRAAKISKLIFLLLFSYCFVLPASAQQYTWWNPAQSKFPVLEGQAWPSEVQHPYDRLPARAEKQVRKEVWNLSHEAAGLSIRFKSNASSIVVRYVVSERLSMPHMPATGVSGLDLYALNRDGQWQWAPGKYSFKDTIEYRFDHLYTDDSYPSRGAVYQLYLPLYNVVTWMEIGVPSNATFTPLPVRPEKPIVVYGTSIAQGACASRPGMAWTAQLGRRLDRQVINLGFSGNGRLEDAVTNLLAGINAQAYILDCMPNLTERSGFSSGEVKKRIRQSVMILKEKHPQTPILLAAHSGMIQQVMDTAVKNNNDKIDETLQEAFTALQAEGVTGIYLMPQQAIGFGENSTVEGTHPNDIGMKEYAEAYEKYLRQILDEPTGDYSTMQPVEQYRDGNYDWEERHDRLLSMNKQHAPDILFLGNSITHYWGGEPKAPIARGTASWDSLFAPLGARNFGFGWDRIENVLWRVYHDELDGYQARKAVLMIGTNNLQFNNDEEIIAGLKLLIHEIQARQPSCKIIMVGLLPRRSMEDKVKELNQQIAQMAALQNVAYVNPGILLLKDNDPTKIDESLFVDGLHPNETGYRKIALSLIKYLKN